MKNLAVGTALCLVTFYMPAYAGEADALNFNGPKSGFFIGLGAGYNLVNFHQDLYGLGISNVSSGATLLAKGLAQGPAKPFHDAQFTFAAEAQLGYFAHFADSNWLWGIKSKYKYAGTTFTERGIIVPQNGAYVPTNGDPATPLAGNAIIESSRTSINHELTLLALLGRSFGNSTVYLGAGPALFGTRSNLNGAVGFASINGMPTDITGDPVSFSSSKWMWGSAAQIGATYYFAPTWFVDLNYSYAASGKYRNDYSAPFMSSSNGLTYTGTAYIATWQRVTSQAVAASINKLFSF